MYFKLKWAVPDKQLFLNSTTNHFKTGRQDIYQLIAEVPVSEQYATINISNIPADFYKIIIEGKYNTVNRWYVKEKAN